MGARDLVADPIWRMLDHPVMEGDCLELLRCLPDESVDAVVCDPPAGIAFMGREWDRDRGGRDAWIAWLAEAMGEALRACKPGAHALVWALPRTSHWTAMAMEDAGWEVRDRLAHMFGTGFPKGLDVGKAIDKAAGVEREVVGVRASFRPAANAVRDSQGFQDRSDGAVTVPATAEAAQWSGWNTTLKPAMEDWWLCRKPLAGSVAETVLAYGTGAINVGGCRIEGDVPSTFGGGHPEHHAVPYSHPEGRNLGRLRPNGELRPDAGGRWPAHVVVDPEAAELLDAQSGGASRLLYVAKAARSEREAGLRGRVPCSMCGGIDSAEHPHPTASAGVVPCRRNVHDTVKGLALMRWLVRLVTPPGGVVLDPFVGSGSTGCAAALEGAAFLGFEREPDYVEIARARIAHVVEHGERYLDPPKPVEQIEGQLGFEEAAA